MEEKIIKPKFNIKNYPGDYAMHCDEEWKAKMFCEYLDSVGKKWCTSKSYLKKSHWDKHKENTCYVFNEGGYCSKQFAKNEGYQIFVFDNYDWSGSDNILSLTEDEKEELETLQEDGFRFITRDKDNILRVSEYIPRRTDEYWEVYGDNQILNPDLFKFISWEDENPTKIKDLI